MKLSDIVKKKLKEHSKHHTAKHIARMRLFMVKGDSFATAHKKALKLK
jgi:hypothetical protein